MKKRNYLVTAMFWNELWRDCDEKKKLLGHSNVLRSAAKAEKLELYTRIQYVPPQKGNT